MKVAEQLGNGTLMCVGGPLVGFTGHSREYRRLRRIATLEQAQSLNGNDTAPGEKLAASGEIT